MHTVHDAPFNLNRKEISMQFIEEILEAAQMSPKTAKEAAATQKLLAEVAVAFGRYFAEVTKEESESQQQSKPFTLRPHLRRPGSCREAVRAVVKAEPGLYAREVIQRLPDRNPGTVRANLAVLVKTREAAQREGRFYYIG
jgi:hypothetical protein